MIHKEELQKQLKAKQRRLDQRKEQAAKFGINTPPEIRTEIEDLETEIEQLQAELKQVTDANEAPAPPKSIGGKSRFDDKLTFAIIFVALLGVIVAVVIFRTITDNNSPKASYLSFSIRDKQTDSVLSRATVRLETGCEKIRSGLTGEDGLTRIEIPTSCVGGQATMVVQAAGYAPYREEISLSPGELPIYVLLEPISLSVAPVAGTATSSVVKTSTPAPPPTSLLEASLDPKIRSVDGMTMVYVPAGSFMMGSDESDPHAQEGEKSPHPVTLDAFWIDRTEVTNAQFQEFVRDTGYRTTAEKEGGGWTYAGGKWDYVEDIDWQQPFGPDSEAIADHPVVLVSWDDASAYCAWAGARLPTEAEWEYAARGPEELIYPWGNEFDGLKLNFCDTNCDSPDWKNSNYDDGYKLTAPVGHFSGGASWVGALDMAGNVWEWVTDWYREDYYVISPVDNPPGPENGDRRVLRGGGWFNDIGDVRAAFRYYNLPVVRNGDYGFRCVIVSEDAGNRRTEQTATLVSVATARPTPPTPIPTPTLAPGATSIRTVDGMTMISVPAGTFMMGSADDPNAGVDEIPQHPVSLDPFWIDQTEVTNDQYNRCVEAGVCQPSFYADDPDFNGVDYPVVGISWDDARAYCQWAGGRLPTEAEWEKAARGTDGRMYPWGNNSPTKTLLNFNDNRGNTASVGSYPAGASRVGALDLAGNVWEWVNDWYGNYTNSPAENPSGPNSGISRVQRGGSWRTNEIFVRVTTRGVNPPDTQHDDLGFRCAVTP